jgi:hydrogenase maturation factor
VSAAPDLVAASSAAQDLGPVADDLARASLALARRFNAGGTMWCVSTRWPFHAHHVAVEFVHPVIMGKRALPALTVVPHGMVATLRASVRPGDMICALAPAGDTTVADAMRRGQAWGVETIWLGHGARPPAGAADHVIWLDTDDELEASEQFVRLYHMLWELVHVCFEHTGLLKPEPECTDEVCITCSDEGRLSEVVAVEGDEAVVRTPDGEERIDISLVDAPQPGDLLLVHAGFAIGAGSVPERNAGSVPERNGGSR